MNGITYFKLDAPYEGDRTKNCALSAAEMDNNFYVLESRDIKNVEFVDGEIVVTLLNGDRIQSHGALNGYAKNLEFKFDQEKGELTILQNGDEYRIGGFVTTTNLSIDHPEIEPFELKSDDTIIGDGSSLAPIGIAPTAKTGQYKPVLKIIDSGCCGCHPKKMLPCNPSVGDRYITKEVYNDYGFLYNFEGIKKLRCDLKEAGYEWDIPSKLDWDSMLNAIEPCDEFRNHSEVTTHRYLGRKAGKYLKATYDWKYEPEGCDCDCHDDDCDCHEHHHHDHFDHHHHHIHDDEHLCHDHEDVCIEPDEHLCIHGHSHHNGHVRHHEERYPNYGINKFGFSVLPAGFADEDKNYMYYTERAFFWTKTNSGYGAYIKRFDFDSSKVYQDTIDLGYYASVRLVKKWTGHEYRGAEEIFGESYPTVILPNSEGGYNIWTTINLQLNNKRYKPMELPIDCPNDTIRYYINEWNGKLWVKNQLKEGESVVVIQAPKDKTSVEYRVINSVLTDVSESTFNDVMSEVDKEIVKITDELKDHEDRITNLENGLEAEIGRAEAAEKFLDNKIDEETKRAVDEENRISAALEQETNNRIAVDNQQWEAINNEVKTREDEDVKIYDALAQETNDRIAVDNQQWEAINNEVERAQERENEIEAQIPNETSYDNKTGEISFKRDGEDKFVAKLDFNFGEF